jgi:hypothetical protein
VTEISRQPQPPNHTTNINITSYLQLWLRPPLNSQAFGEQTGSEDSSQTTRQRVIESARQQSQAIVKIMSIPQPLRKRRLSGLSNAFAALALDPMFAEWANPLYVVSMTYFETNPGLDLMQKTVQERILVRGKLAVPRMLSRFVDVGGHTEAHELDVDDIDVNYHVQAVEQDRPWHDADVQDLANKLTAEGLDPMRPLWRYVLVEELADGRAVLLMLFNHCVGDGNSMSQMSMRRMVDTPKNTPALKRASSRRKSQTNRRASSTRDKDRSSTKRRSSKSNRAARRTYRRQPHLPKAARRSERASPRHQCSRRCSHM